MGSCHWSKVTSSRAIRAAKSQANPLHFCSIKPKTHSLTRGNSLRRSNANSNSPGVLQWESEAAVIIRTAVSCILSSIFFTREWRGELNEGKDFCGLMCGFNGIDRLYQRREGLFLRHRSGHEGGVGFCP